jgi:hypothetical protein
MPPARRFRQTDKNWHQEIVGKLSEIFERILLGKPKPGDEFDEKLINKKLEDFIIPAKKIAVREYKYQREQDFYAVR